MPTDVAPSQASSMPRRRNSATSSAETVEACVEPKGRGASTRIAAVRSGGVARKVDVPFNFLPRAVCRARTGRGVQSASPASRFLGRELLDALARQTEERAGIPDA